MYSIKLWSVCAAGATGTDSTAIKSATHSIEKVMGKVKAKIKRLKKEGELEKKAVTARKAKQRRLQHELLKELAIKRKIRKNKARRDVEWSRWKCGAPVPAKLESQRHPWRIRLAE